MRFGLQLRLLQQHLMAFAYSAKRQRGEPKLLFDRLFGDGSQAELAESHYRRRARKQSLLDFVTDDARQLQRRLSRTDRQKMEQYLDGIREVERRLDKPPELYSGEELTRPEGIPDDYGKHVRLMGDLMLLAFQADLTRVSTFMMANEGSNIKYSEIDLREGHHSLSHHQNNQEKIAAISKINRYHVEQFAYIVSQMATIQEGERTLLDNTAVVYGSAIRDGDLHDHSNLPIIVAGGAGGKLPSGQHLTFPENTPLMNLFLTLLQQAGAPVNSVGDSTKPLALA